MRVTAPADKPVRLASTGGTVVFLNAGETREVPAMFTAAAISAGCITGDTGATPAPIEVSEPVEDTVREAIQLIIDGGDPEHFTSQNKPKVSIVREMAGRDVSASEVNAIFEEIMNVG